MQKYLQARALHLDLRSCAEWDGNRALKKLLDDQLLSGIPLSQDDQHAEFVETEKMEKSLGSSAFLAELVPLLSLRSPLKVHREENNRNPWRSRSLLYRFSDAGNSDPSSTGCCDTAAVNRNGLSHKGFCSESPERTPCYDHRSTRFGRNSDDLEASYATEQECIVRWLQEIVPVMGDDLVRPDEDLIPSGMRRIMGPPTEQALMEQRQCRAAKAVERLVPLPRLSQVLLDFRLGASTATEVVQFFDVLIQPCVNLGLPAAFRPHRMWIHDAIRRALNADDHATSWCAFELWARLNPVPFDLLDDVLPLMDDGTWLDCLNEMQVCRVALLLADIILNIPGTDEAGVFRDQICRSLVEWSECGVSRNQALARAVLHEVFGWTFEPIFRGCDDRNEPIARAKNKLPCTDDRQLQLTTLLEATSDSDSDPWNGIGLVPGDDDLKWPNTRIYEHRWNARLEAALYKNIVQRSQSEVARTISLWNLGWFGVVDPHFREDAHNAYHLSRNLRTSSFSLARRFVRERNGGFLQDYGPVAPEGGRIFERAALRIMSIKEDETMYRRLVAHVRRLTSLDHDRSEDLLEEFLHSAFTSDATAIAFVRLDLQERGAYSYVARRFDFWLLTAYRDQRSEHRMIEAFAVATCSTYASKLVGVDRVPPAHHESTSQVTESLSPNMRPVAAVALDRAFRQIARIEAAQEREGLFRRLESSLGCVPERQAMAAYFRLYCGYSAKRAAAIMGISVSKFDTLFKKAAKAIGAAACDRCR